MRHIFLALFLFLFVGLLSAQDLYELKFKDSNNTKYKGLLVVFNDSKMYMRVGYTSESKYQVVNISYTSQHGKEDDVSYLALIGSNAKFITQKGNHGYSPDHLIFINDMDLPIITDNLKDLSNVTVADAFKPLKKRDVTDQYLRQFYKKNESDYLALKRMFGLSSDRPVSKRYTKPTTLHLIVIANTAINDIGSGCQVDQQNLLSEFQGISNALGIGYKQHIINGQNFTKSNVDSKLNNLHVGSNDIVICVYRGHGFRWSDQEKTWPQLDMRTSSYTRLTANTTLSLDNLYKKIVNKGARLNIILGDCCNSDIGISRITNDNFLAMQGQNNYNINKLRKLFLDARGNMLSCSASPGEYSWVNSANGGFFTVSFLQSLREEISYLKNDAADWADVINNTIRGAKQKTNSCSKCTSQNGKYYSNIKN